MKDVHAEILNLPVKSYPSKSTATYHGDFYDAYSEGHKEARCTAASLILPLRERLAELERKEKHYGDARALLRDCADKIKKGKATPAERRLQELEALLRELLAYAGKACDTSELSDEGACMARIASLLGSQKD